MGKKKIKIEEHREGQPTGDTEHDDFEVTQRAELGAIVEGATIPAAGELWTRNGIEGLELHIWDKTIKLPEETILRLAAKTLISRTLAEMDELEPLEGFSRLVNSILIMQHHGDAQQRKDQANARQSTASANNIGGQSSFVGEIG